VRQEDAVGPAVREPEAGPTACASAWLTPTKAFEKARPAIVEAFAIAVRASRSSRRRTPRQASKISRAACTQNASVYGVAKIETAASIACVSASMPVSAVLAAAWHREREHRVDDRHVGTSE
jgi:hypothetical protein